MKSLPLADHLVPDGAWSFNYENASSKHSPKGILQLVVISDKIIHKANKLLKKVVSLRRWLQ